MLNLYIILAPTVIIAAFFIIVAQFKKLKHRYSRIYEKNTAILEKSFMDMEEEDRAASAQNKDLDKKISETANLYEITKEMSAALRSLDIFKILAKFLRKNFSFNSCTLALISRKDPGALDKVYKTSGAEIRSVEPDEKTSALIERIKKDKEIIKISSCSKVMDAEKNYLPAGIKSFLAAPLVIEDEIIGALSIENLSPGEFDNFLILSRQFMLEARKAALYEKVEELAIIDGLTGAYVRRHFLERLSEEFRRSRRHKFEFSFLMLDIDHFKRCNDTYGHLVGDAVLARIVDILKANIRQIDLVARFGGEEFCVLLPETGKKDASLVAERIRAAVAEEEFKVYDEFMNTSVSIGLVSFPEDARKRNELIEKADTALYQAKNEGRNRVRTFFTN